MLKGLLFCFIVLITHTYADPVQLGIEVEFKLVVDHADIWEYKDVFITIDCGGFSFRLTGEENAKIELTSDPMNIMGDVDKMIVTAAKLIRYWKTHPITDVGVVGCVPTNGPKFALIDDLPKEEMLAKTISSAQLNVGYPLKAMIMDNYKYLVKLFNNGIVRFGYDPNKKANTDFIDLLGDTKFYSSMFDFSGSLAQSFGEYETAVRDLKTILCLERKSASIDAQDLKDSHMNLFKIDWDNKVIKGQANQCYQYKKYYAGTDCNVGTLMHPSSAYGCFLHDNKIGFVLEVRSEASVNSEIMGVMTSTFGSSDEPTTTVGSTIRDWLLYVWEFVNDTDLKLPLPV